MDLSLLFEGKKLDRTAIRLDKIELLSAGQQCNVGQTLNIEDAECPAQAENIISLLF